MIDTLNNLKLDKQAKIHSLDCSGSVRRRLLDLGLTKDALITAVLQSPSGNLMAYEVRGTIIAIRNEDAQKILINP